MNFYRIWFDERDTDEWVLSNAWDRDGRAIDVWSYVRCIRGQRDPAPWLKIRRPGVHTTFELVGPEQVPVASPRIARLLKEMACDQFESIPAMVEDGTAMEIINVLACIDCIDYDKSILECFGPNTKVRADRAGELHVDLRLVIDPNRVGDSLIFRLRDLKAPVIVAQPIKQALEEANVTGIVFQPVLTNCDDSGHLQYWDHDLRRKVIWPREEREQFLRSRGK
jgi:uncharacterized protein DUF1629